MGVYLFLDIEKCYVNVEKTKKFITCLNMMNMMNRLQSN